MTGGGTSVAGAGVGVKTLSVRGFEACAVGEEAVGGDVRSGFVSCC